MLTTMSAWCAYPLNYEVSMTLGGGKGEFAPYYISSLRHGKISQQYNAQIEGIVWKPLDAGSRFSYGFGIDLIGGYASNVEYGRYDSQTGWYKHSVNPSTGWIQQLYGEIKYRSIHIEAGLKEYESALLNQRLTSGDLIESGNARPIPQVRIGLIDFQDIPFTSGWVQIQGEVGYGKYTDFGWIENHYSYYNDAIEKGEWYNYKRCYFRTNPSKPFSITLGMQAVAQFGGTQKYYYKGELTRTQTYPVKFNTFFKMLIPTQDGGEGFYTGDHIGAWDIRTRYKLKNGDKLYAYCSWLWTDGSGIGKLNGWDGLWGLEYKAGRCGFITGALVEYFDYTNQSGPIHYAPGDHLGGTLNDHASGSDNYYNNGFHRSYANYGMSIGSPAFMAPIYNINGFPAFVANMMRGVHVGVEGSVTKSLTYRIKGGYRKAWGTGAVILPAPLHSTSVMVEGEWIVKEIPGLKVSGQMAIDRGTMPCNAFGVMATVKYDGIFNIK